MFNGGCVIADAELLGGKTIVVRSGFGFKEVSGEGLTIIFPLLHTSFFPFFMQVNIIPPDFDVAPTLRQTAPGVTFATAETTEVSNTKSSISRITSGRFMVRLYK